MGGAEGKVAYIGEQFQRIDLSTNQQDTEGTFRPERCVRPCMYQFLTIKTGHHRRTFWYGSRHGLTEHFVCTLLGCRGLFVSHRLNRYSQSLDATSND
jgi:hypothetical protein